EISEEENEGQGVRRRRGSGGRQARRGAARRGAGRAHCKGNCGDAGDCRGARPAQVSRLVMTPGLIISTILPSRTTCLCSPPCPRRGIAGRERVIQGVVDRVRVATRLDNLFSRCIPARLDNPLRRCFAARLPGLPGWLPLQRRLTHSLLVTTHDHALRTRTGRCSRRLCVRFVSIAPESRVGTRDGATRHRPVPQGPCQPGSTAFPLPLVTRAPNPGRNRTAQKWTRYPIAILRPAEGAKSLM